MAPRRWGTGAIWIAGTPNARLTAPILSHEFLRSDGQEVFERRRLAVIASSATYSAVGM